MSKQVWRAVVSTHYREASVQQIASSLRDTSHLQLFMAPLHVGTRNQLGQTLLKYQPGRELSSRFSYDPPARSIHPIAQAKFTLQRKLRSDSSQAVLSFAAAIDAKSARQISRQHPEATIGMAFSSLETFRMASAMGTSRVLNAINPELRGRNEMWRELVSNAPDNATAEQIGRELLESGLVDRNSQEIAEANLIICPSHLTATSYRAVTSSTTHVAVIPYGVDVRLFRPIERDSDNRKIRVGYVGMLNYRKGIHDLFQAVQTPGKDVAVLRMVGPPVASKSWLSSLWPSTIDTEHFVRLDHHGIAKFHQSIDVLIVPSLSDSFGLVVLESMASGVPVIATNAVGASELIEDGVDGFIVPPSCPSEIADRISELANNGRRRRKMSEAARRKAEDNSWTTYRERIVETLDGLLNRE